MSFHRLAGIAGIAFVIMIISSAALMGDAPLVEADAAEVRSYLAEDQRIHRLSSLLTAFAIPFGLLFFAAVVASLRASDQAHGEAWSLVALLGAVAMLISATIGDVLLYVAFLRGGEGLDDATLRLLWDGQLMAFAAMGAGIAVFTASVSVSSLLHGAWPRWHAILGLIATAVNLVAPLSLISATNNAEAFSNFAFPALLVWSLATSVMLVRGRLRAHAEPSTSTRRATAAGSH